MQEPRERWRWWPAGAIMALAAAGLAWAWLAGDVIRQTRVMASLAVGAVALLLLALWFVAFSRAPRRARRGVALALAGAAAAAASLVRVRGVTGDFVPILAWRWSAPPAAPPAPAPVERTEARVAPAPGLAEPAPRAAPRNAPGPAPGATPAAASELAPLHDHPEFQGRERRATLDDVELDGDWSGRPPRVLWRRPVGAAWSGFAVVGGIAVTQEQHGEEERVCAYALASGRPLWSHGDRARYATVIAGEGPRATPTIAGGRVFALGATGRLNAFELRTGRRLWSRDLPRESGAAEPEWGRSASPLVVDERVVVSAGGPDGRSLLAYDAATGAPAWSAGSDGASYSSPLVATLAGERQLVMLNAGSLSGHAPDTGRLLWEQPWPRGQPNVSQPLPLGADRLLVSVGYGVGSALFRLARADDGAFRVHELWRSPRLKSKFGTLVERDGFVYGLDDGVLTCLDPADGQRRWKGGRYGHGQLLRVGALLLVQSEEGELLLVDAVPDGHRERARLAVLDGKTWNPPALASPYLLMRNEREAALVELPLRARIAAR